MSDLEAAWNAVHDALPVGWYVGRPSYHDQRREWVQYAFDPRSGLGRYAEPGMDRCGSDRGRRRARDGAVPGGAMGGEVAAVSEEAAPPSARYVRCRGGGWTDYPPGADSVFLRIVPFEGYELYEGYVLLDASGQVVEKTNRYGMFDDVVEDDEHCTPIDHEAFLEAWRRPYAKRSLRRRFLSWLNGCRDQEQPE